MASFIFHFIISILFIGNDDQDAVSYDIDMRLLELPVGEAEIVYSNPQFEHESIIVNVCLTDTWCYGNETVTMQHYQDYFILNITSIIRKLSKSLEFFALGESNGKIIIHLYSSVKNLSLLEQQLVIHTLPKYEYMSKTRSKTYRKRRSSDAERNSNEEMCTLHPWTLNFQDLGFENWIIQPKYYEANVCRGSCSIDDHDEKNMSSHSYLRQMYRKSTEDEHDLELIPPAVCVPLDMHPINILYVDQGQPRVKRMAEMIADACGCY